MKKIRFIPLLFVLAMSCHDDKLTDPEKIIEQKIFQPSDDVFFNGMYLVFPTPQSFEQTRKSLINATPESVRKWTDNLGFTSQRTIYENAVKAQEKYLSDLVALYDSYPKDDPRLKVAPVINQPEYVKQHSNLLVFNKDGLIAYPAVSNYDIAALINEDGLVKIAGHIFQYNAENIKIIVGGDTELISKLPSIERTNKKLKVLVHDIRHEYIGQNGRKLKSPEGRVWYDYSAQSQHWIDPNDIDIFYYMNYEIHISYYTYPIYDTTPVCQPEGCGQARSKDDCYCYYPIIGATAYSRFENHMESRKIVHHFYGDVNTQHESFRGTISVDYAINHGLMSNHASYTSAYLVNTYLTVYDGTPAIEFTCGSHNFDERFTSILEQYETVSWCD